MPTSPFKPRTIAAQALGAIEPADRAVALPVHVSTTYIRDPDNQYRTGYIYGRPDNATVRQTEAVIARARRRARGDAVRLRHGGGDRVVLALPPGEPRARAAGLLLGFSRLADPRGAVVRLRGRSRRHGGPRGGARRDEAATPSWSGSRRRAIRSGTSPTSRPSPRSRTRPARCSASIRPPRRRCSRGRSRSAPTS